MIVLHLIFVLFFIIDPAYQQYLQLYENSSCTTDDGAFSICKRFEDCPTAGIAVKSGKRPKICGFNGHHPIICCPKSNNLQSENTVNINGKVEVVADEKTKPSSQSNAVDIAEKKCYEYTNSEIVTTEPSLTLEDSNVENVEPCFSDLEMKIVGGLHAKPRQFPHMALIGFGEKDPVWLCGGSLISERYVVSAAHCSNLGGLGSAQWVLLGDLDTSTDLDQADPKMFKIVKRIDHQLYDPKSFYNDITLFKLERDVEFSPYIKPICLSTEANITEDRAIATGWGHTSWGGEASTSLMNVDLLLVNNEVCNQAYNETKKRPRGILEDSMICAGGEMGKSTCQADSGGALQILKADSCIYNLIGLTSNGGKCGYGSPTIFTRVSHFLQWIVSNVWPDE